MFYIQDPRVEHSVLLNEALLDACKNALYGAGTYAFVSADGLELLMKSSEFEHFMNEGHYFLLMGLDDITNQQSLEKAEKFCNIYPNLSIRAFVHHTLGSTFHPKFSWFKWEQGGVLVLGSGNLTFKGLRRNTEAFVIQQVDEAQILEIEQKWNDWIERSKNCIKTLDDPQVIQRATQNNKKLLDKIMQTQMYPTFESIESFRFYKNLLLDKSHPNSIIEDEADAWSFEENSEVLITEIPIQQGRRLGQRLRLKLEASLAKNIFGSEPGVEQLIVLRRVMANGELSGIETSSIHTSFNGNCQLLLRPPERIMNGEEECFIGIFAKAAVRTLLYMIVTPDEPCYRALKEQLNNYRWDIKDLAQHQTDAHELEIINDSLTILKHMK